MFADSDISATGSYRPIKLAKRYIGQTLIQTERHSRDPDVKTPFIFSIEKHKSTILPNIMLSTLKNFFCTWLSVGVIVFYFFIFSFW